MDEVNQAGREAKSLDEIIADAKRDIDEIIDQWGQTFAVDTKNLGSFPTISQLEKSLGELDSKARELFISMLSDSLSNINEKEVIASKKENSSKRG